MATTEKNVLVLQVSVSSASQERMVHSRPALSWLEPCQKDRIIRIMITKSPKLFSMVLTRVMLYNSTQAILPLNSKCICAVEKRPSDIQA